MLPNTKYRHLTCVRYISVAIALLGSNRVLFARAGISDRDGAEIRARYAALGDIYRRKALKEVFSIADRSYKTVGADGKVRSYVADSDSEARYLREVTRVAYGFDIRFLKVHKDVAQVQAIESGYEYTVLKGRKRWRRVYGLRRDVWRKVSGRWKLFLTQYPRGLRVSPSSAPGPKPTPAGATLGVNAETVPRSTRRQGS